MNLRIPSKMDSLTTVEKLVDEICTEFKVDNDHYGNMLVAVTEAVNNAINHGNKQDPDKFVDVNFRTDGQEMCFKIQDEGSGFDYNNIPDPTAPENIEKPHGRGVFLMKNLADTVDFQNDGRIIELRFVLS